MRIGDGVEVGGGGGGGRGGGSDGMGKGGGAFGACRGWTRSCERACRDREASTVAPIKVGGKVHCSCKTDARHVGA